ncbi:MAG TPA: UDP-N-acetylglucosamine 2-epimerase (non-hydrolyzing) [Nitrososphaeraceae archaeon]|nr:UDP-N-acetylglucosamine 2-epimerase (non-hydrolyzing) [Nitrososphaeraceae archaeon]
MKIASIVGARPNFVKLGPIHKSLKGSGNEHLIFHTGQHYDYEMSDIFFSEFTLPKPDVHLGVGSGSSCFHIGEIIKRLESKLLEKQIDLVLVYGDTNSTLAGAICANKCNIKLGHIEAGLRSYDTSMPEENNRILTDHLSNYLFAPTINAMNNLQKERIRGKVHLTGDLSVEIIRETSSISKKSKILDILNLKSKSYLLFTMHRAENTSSKYLFVQLLETFEALKDSIIVFPIHPRTKKMFESFGLLKRLLDCANVRTLLPIGYIDFIALLQNSLKIVTDSGGIQKEAYLLKVPCVTMRRNTEWIETLKGQWNVLTGVDSRKIVKAIKRSSPGPKYSKWEFGNGKTSHVISKLLSNIALNQS